MRASDPGRFFGEMQVPVPYEHSFDGLVGVVYDEVAAARVRAHVDVHDELLGPHGAVHGGVYAAVAEGMASTGTAYRVAPAGMVAMGMSNDTTVLEEVSAGTLVFTGSRVRAGEREWLWRVEATDGEGGEPCAHSVVVIAVRPRPATR